MYLRYRSNLFGTFTITRAIGGYMVNVQYASERWGIDFHRRVNNWQEANSILEAAATANKNYGG